MAKERSPRDPHQDKQNSLDRDHRTHSKTSKGFRKQWPRKKATAERAARRKTNQAITDADPESAQESTEVVEREPVRKWPGTSKTLREHLEHKKANREARTNRRKKR